MNDAEYTNANNILKIFEKKIGYAIRSNLNLNKKHENIHPYDILGNPSEIIFNPENGTLNSVKLYNIGFNSFDFLKDFDLSNLTYLSIDKSNLNFLPHEFLEIKSLIILKLLNCLIKEIPKEISNLKNLLELHLSNNDIARLPAEIQNLKRLELINLSNNHISDFPIEIIFIDSLKWLNLSSNAISKIPNSISKLEKLTYLNLSSNQINTIPAALNNLKKLRTLIIKENLIEFLPDLFSNLSDLQYLNLEKNNFKIFPESICNLTRLNDLYISNNKISTIPITIENINNLIELRLSHNPIQMIPTFNREFNRITCLDLSQTKLRSFDFLKSFPNLETLHFGKCNFHQVPDDLIQVVLDLEKLDTFGLNYNNFKTYPRELLPLIKSKGKDLLNVTINPFPLEERFFLEEIYAVDLAMKDYDWMKEISSGEREIFDNTTNRALIDYLEVGEHYFQFLLEKIQSNAPLEFLDLHHPILLTKSEEIRAVCQKNPTETGVRLLTYLIERRQAFHEWQIRRKKAIDVNFDLFE